MSQFHPVLSFAQLYGFEKESPPPKESNRPWPIFGDTYDVFAVNSTVKQRGAKQTQYKNPKAFDEYCQLMADFETYRLQYVTQRNRPVRFDTYKVEDVPPDPLDPSVPPKRTVVVTPKKIIPRIQQQISNMAAVGSDTTELESYQSRQILVWENFDAIITALSENEYVKRKNSQRNKDTSEYIDAMYSLVPK